MKNNDYNREKIKEILSVRIENTSDYLLQNIVDGIYPGRKYTIRVVSKEEMEEICRLSTTAIYDDGLVGLITESAYSVVGDVEFGYKEVIRKEGSPDTILMSRSGSRIGDGLNIVVLTRSSLGIKKYFDLPVELEGENVSLMGHYIYIYKGGA